MRAFAKEHAAGRAGNNGDGEREFRRIFKAMLRQPEAVAL
jgi:hypothetical protein